MPDRETYPKTEMDLKLEAVHAKIDRNHNQVMTELEQHRSSHVEMLKEVRYTNGKVRKIIFALIGVTAFSLGLGLKEANALLALLI